MIDSVLVPGGEIVDETTKGYLPPRSPVVRGESEEEDFFLHVPKCGGTSLNQAIQNSFGLFEDIRGKNFFELNPSASLKASKIVGEELRDYRESLLLYYLSDERYKYISGHFSYSEKAFQEFGKEWSFITLLRHPISRWISHYFYNRFKEPEHFRIDADLESYLESERAISQGGNYVQQFAEGISISDASSNQAVNQAIENLNKFSLVGTLERLGLFARDYKRVFGAELYIKQSNSNPLSKSAQKEQITEDICKRIEEICQPNLRVYKSVQERVQSQNQPTAV